MRRTRWGVAGVGAAVAGLALAGTAATAAPPATEEYRGTELYCSLGEESETTLSLGAWFSPEGDLLDSWGDVQFDETYAYGYGAAGFLDDDGDWEITVDFVTGEFGDVEVGSLTVAGTLTPFGEVQAIDEKWRDGNVLVKVSGTAQQLLGSGVVTAATGDLAFLLDKPLDCGGTDVDVTYWYTQPAARIFRGSAAGAYCELDEDSVLMLDVFGDEAYAAYGDGIDWDTGEAAFIAEGVLAIDGQSISGELPVVVPPPADEPEYVMVDLTIGDLIDSGTDKYHSPQSGYHVRYEVYALTGTLVLPDASVVEVDCQYTTFDYWERYTPNAGQKPGGKPPVNDLPENALILPDGASSSVNTRGAAEMPETACTVEYEGELFEIPFGRTIWYEVTGTGGEVLLTTEGTAFDTVMGVYTADLTQVACVDDAAETGLQASATVPTTEGETYLVQVGGFDGAFGDLVTSRP